VLDELVARGDRPTFAGVAKSAGVSRSWLYESQFADEIRSVRGSTPARTVRSDRASEASLRARLDDAQDEIRRLRASNAELSRQLELALGRSRAESAG
jgi:hypothetical protein